MDASLLSLTAAAVRGGHAASRSSRDGEGADTGGAGAFSSLLGASMARGEEAAGAGLPGPGVGQGSAEAPGLPMALRLRAAALAAAGREASGLEAGARVVADGLDGLDGLDGPDGAQDALPPEAGAGDELPWQDEAAALPAVIDPVLLAQMALVMAPRPSAPAAQGDRGGDSAGQGAALEALPPQAGAAWAMPPEDRALPQDPAPPMPGTDPAVPPVSGAPDGVDGSAGTGGAELPPEGSFVSRTAPPDAGTGAEVDPEGAAPAAAARSSALPPWAEASAGWRPQGLSGRAATAATAAPGPAPSRLPSPPSAAETARAAIAAAASGVPVPAGETKAVLVADRAERLSGRGAGPDRAGERPERAIERTDPAGGLSAAGDRALASWMMPAPTASAGATGPTGAAGIAEPARSGPEALEAFAERAAVRASALSGREEERAQERSEAVEGGFAAALATAGLAAPPQAAAATPVAASRVETPFGQPQFTDEVVAHVAQHVSQSREGVREVVLHLNPAEMGPVSVRIEIEGQVASVDFGATHEATRHQLEQSLPALADALRDDGLSLGRSSVGDQAGQGSFGGSASGGGFTGQNDGRQREAPTPRDGSSGTPRFSVEGFSGEGAARSAPVRGEPLQRRPGRADGLDLFA